MMNVHPVITGHVVRRPSVGRKDANKRLDAFVVAISGSQQADNRPRIKQDISHPGAVSACPPIRPALWSAESATARMMSRRGGVRPRPLSEAADGFPSRVPRSSSDHGLCNIARERAGFWGSGEQKWPYALTRSS